MRFDRRGLGYVGAFDEGGVEIALDHLRRKGGDLHGEISVAAAVVPKGHLHRANFNASSSTSRKTLSTMLRERSAPQEFPWAAMLEEFCLAVLEGERQGTPIVKVGAMPAHATGLDAFRVKPIVPEGKTAILYGAGGTGKSYLAVGIAVSVATGRPLLPDWSVVKAPVLYLDWETDAAEIDERVKAVAAGMGVRAPEIDYRACNGSLEDMAEDLSRHVAAEGIGLVVVDSTGMASGAGREGSDANEATLRLFSGIRYLGCSVLAIDHITGEDVKSASGVAKPYGSIYKVNLARSVWELRRHDEAVVLYHRKVNRGPLHEPIALSVVHEPTSVTFSKTELDPVDLVAGMTQQKRLLLLLRDGPMTVADLAEKAGMTDASVRTVLSRGNGTLFTKLDDHRWALVYRGPQHVAPDVAEVA